MKCNSNTKSSSTTRGKASNQHQPVNQQQQEIKEIDSFAQQSTAKKSKRDATKSSNKKTSSSAKKATIMTGKKDNQKNSLKNDDTSLIVNSTVIDIAASKTATSAASKTTTSASATKNIASTFKLPSTKNNKSAQVTTSREAAMLAGKDDSTTMNNTVENKATNIEGDTKYYDIDYQDNDYHVDGYTGNNVDNNKNCYENNENQIENHGNNGENESRNKAAYKSICKTVLTTTTPGIKANEQPTTRDKSATVIKDTNNSVGTKAKMRAPLKDITNTNTTAKKTKNSIINTAATTTKNSVINNNNNNHTSNMYHNDNDNDVWSHVPSVSGTVNSKRKFGKVDNQV